MTGLLTAEWLKLRKRLMPRVLLLIMLALIALIFWGIAANGRDHANVYLPRAWLVVLFLTPFVGQFLWPILAGSWAGNEYGWGTIRLVLSHRPSRTRFVLGGVLMMALTLALALIAVLAVGTVAGALAATLNGHSVVDSSGLGSDFPLLFVKSLFAVWYVLLFYVVVSFAAGTVFRSGAVGIGVGIGIIVAELALRGIFYALGSTWRDVSNHFPDVYAAALSSGVMSEGFVGNFGTGDSSATVGESLIGLSVYIAVPLVLALLLVRTRDVTA